ncbi:MAG: clostripain-related cysteine peptidase [Spirochaetota bacterium]
MRRTTWIGRPVAALTIALLVLGCVPPTMLDPVAVTELTRAGAEWVIVVYMSGDNELEAQAIEDLNEMEAAGLRGSGVTVVALVDRGEGHDASNGDWTGTRLYEVADDPDGVDASIVSVPLAVPSLGIDPSGPDVELDMADPQTLSLLLAFVRDTYAPEHTALVIWGHGSGYRSDDPSARSPAVGVSRATSYDDASGGDALYTAELARAISGAGLELVGFDTCFGASLEVAYELRDEAGLMVASQSLEPADGWEYDDLLARFASGPRTAASLADAITTSYATIYAGVAGASISATRLDRIDAVMRALDEFARVAHAHAADAEERDALRATLFYEAEDFYTTPGDLAIDVADAARVVTDRHGYAGAQAAGLAGAVDAAVVSSWSGSAHPRANGISVHLIPLEADGTAAASHDEAYLRGSTVEHPLAFVAASAWVPAPLERSGLLYRLFYEVL